MSRTNPDGAPQASKHSTRAGRRNFAARNSLPPTVLLHT